MLHLHNINDHTLSGQHSTPFTMKATDTFRTSPWRHNCVQAVAYHWHKLYSEKDIVAEFAPYVGGRAPKGYCGALYAAMQACPLHADKIREEFESVTGDILCHDIKQKNHTPCEVCVDTADKLVGKYAIFPHTAEGS